MFGRTHGEVRAQNDVMSSTFSQNVHLHFGGALPIICVVIRVLIILHLS